MKIIINKLADKFLITVSLAFGIQFFGTIYVIFNEAVNIQKTYSETGYVRNGCIGCFCLLFATFCMFLAVLISWLQRKTGELFSILFLAFSIITNGWLYRFAIYQRQVNNNLILRGHLHNYDIEFIYFDYWEWWFFLANLLAFVAVIITLINLVKNRTKAN